MSCDDCRRLLLEESDSDTLARDLEAAAPHCACQHVAMSDASPGPVDSSEVLHRVMVSPRDYDSVTNTIAKRPFEKLFKNGLSVMRDIGTDQDFLDIAEDSLLSRPGSDLRAVQAVCSAIAGEIRSLEGPDGLPAFCIYDQLVPRNIPDTDPVPTHAGIFQRNISYDVEGAKKANKDLSLLVYERFVAGIYPAASFREDLFKDLNEKAARGDYVTP